MERAMNQELKPKEMIFIKPQNNKFFNYSMLHCRTIYGSTLHPSLGGDSGGGNDKKGW
jgi:hypothetical protein